MSTQAADHTTHGRHPSGSDIAKSMLKSYLVPVMVGIYLVLFWRSTSGMPLGGLGVPRLLIAAIALLLVVAVARETIATVRQLRSPTDPPLRSPSPDAKSDVEIEAELEDGAEVDDTGSCDDASSSKASWRPVIAIVVGLLAYWLLLARIGAYPSTALFVVGLSLGLGYRKPPQIIGAAVLCVAVVYAFIRIFTLPLPGFALDF